MLLHTEPLRSVLSDCSIDPGKFATMVKCRGKSIDDRNWPTTRWMMVTKRVLSWEQSTFDLYCKYTHELICARDIRCWTDTHEWRRVQKNILINIR